MAVCGDDQTEARHVRVPVDGALAAFFGTRLLAESRCEFGTHPRPPSRTSRGRPVSIRSAEPRYTLGNVKKQLELQRTAPDQHFWASVHDRKNSSGERKATLFDF